MTNPLPPGFSKPVASNWCHCVSEIVKVDFQWTIQYFDVYLKCGKLSKFVSSEFSAKELPSLKWKLEMEPPTTAMYINLFYSDKAAVSQTIPFRVKGGILNKKGEKVCTVDTKYDSIGKSEYSYKFHIPFLKVYTDRAPFNSSHEYKNSISDEGHLTFIFEIELFFYNKTIVSGETMKNESFNSNNELSNHIAGIWESKKFRDITFNVNGTVFQAHKVILSARSPVFAAMFEQPMKEKLSNQVVVTDVDSDVFEQVLRFIYTGQVPASKMNILAPGLLAAADKYMLENLKNECEKHLANKLSVENCVDFLILADRHSAHNLEQNALNVFRLYPTQVFSSDNWIRMTQNKTLLNLLYGKYVFNNSVKTS